MRLWNKIIAGQLRKPSGLLAGLIRKRLEKNNAKTNDWVISLLNIEPEDRILEIGYGPGYAIEKVSDLAGNGLVAGVDFSRAMYKAAYKKNSKKIKEGKIQLHCCDTLHIPYGDNYFNKTYAINVVYFWKDPLPYLKEIMRTIRPGGLSTFYLTDKDSLNKMPITDPSVFNKYSEPEFTKVLEQAGFCNIKVHKQIIERMGLFLTSLCFMAEKT